MKYIITILATFIIAFATSLLFDLNFIKTNLQREILLSLFIIIELLAGFIIVKRFAKEEN